jgi:hypothetical protein
MAVEPSEETLKSVDKTNLDDVHTGRQSDRYTHSSLFLKHKLQPSLNLCTHSEYTICTESGYGMLITNIITHSPN